MTKSLLLGCLLLAATACSKKDDGSGTTPTPEPTIDFGPNNGYTTRTASNVPAGQTDPTDWTSDATWNATEQQLFTSLKLSLTGTQLPASVWTISCYPNPCSLSKGNCAVFIAPDLSNAALPAGSARVDFVFVDSHYKTLLALNNLEVPRNNGGLLTLPSLDPTKFTVNTLCRVYYVIYAPGQQVYYRGHGDIKVES